MDPDEIWHGGGPWGWEGFWGVQPESLSWVWGASGALTVHFGENFIKQKLQGTPNLMRAGQLFWPKIWIRKDLGPMSFWSHGHSL